MSSLTLSLLLRRASNPTAPPTSGPNTLTIALTVAVLVFALTAILVTVGFMYQRRRRSSIARRSDNPFHSDEEEELPTYDMEKRLSSISTTSSSQQHRRVLTRPANSPVYSEKQSRLPSPPASPIPEIRITFPEEYDDKGHRKSGAVVVVRVGEMGGVGGLEGTTEVEGLAGYERDGEGRWQSVDLERVGGLVETARNKPVRRE